MKLKHYILGIIIILIDQLSKYLIIDKYISVIPNILEFNYTKNIGGGFGIGNINIVMIFSIIIILGIIAYLIVKRKNITNFIPFILILSGSIGNLIDRIFRGYVIDFIDVNIFNYPNFNIADMSIVIGVFILLILIIKKILKYKK